MKSKLIATFAGLALLAATSLLADEGHTSTQFKGPKANTGTVTHTVQEVVDSKGNTYLLQKLKVKGTLKDKVNTTITVPAYVSDISKVQIWCGYAEVVLGEAAFARPVQITSR